jgi:hypothetical protein
MKTQFYNLIATLGLFTIFGNISPAVFAIGLTHGGPETGVFYEKTHCSPQIR